VPNNQLGWINLPHSTNTTTTSDCQTPSGHITGDQPKQGIDGNGRKDFEERRVLRQE